MNKNLLKGLGLVLLVTLVSLATIRIASVSGVATLSTDEIVYSKVLKTGVMTACYIVTPPSLAKDPNTGKLSGISYDVLEEASKNLGLKVDWKYQVGWGEAIEALNSGKCDVVGSAIWGNSTRAKNSEFIQPVYYSAINAYVRADDSRFDGSIKSADSEKVKLAVADGSTTYLIAGRQFPKAQTVKLTEKADSAMLMLEVVSGKADMTFVETSQALLYQKNNPGKIKMVTNVKPVAVFEDVMLVKKGEYKLKSTLDGAIRELINGGFIDKVLDENEKENPGIFYRVASPYVIPK